MVGPTHPLRDRLREALLDSRVEPLVADHERVWTGDEILHAAGAIHRALSARSGPVGIACYRPGWLLASLVGAWSARRAPVLLDPSLKRELDTLSGLYPDIEILSDGGAGNRSVEVIVHESPQRLDTAWLALPEEEDPMACLFTSGSEGVHKVVEKTTRQMLRQLAALLELLGLPPQCRVLSFVPPFHLLGFFYGIMLPLASQGRTMVVDKLTGPAMSKLLDQEHPDLVVGTATHYRYLLRATPTSTSQPSTLFLSSGAPLDPAVAEEFVQRFGTAIKECYGTTEVGGVAWRTGSSPYEPWPGVRWRAEPETQRLQILSPWAVARGEPDWIATDDAVEGVDAHRFRLLGRLGHLVKVGGKRFSSVEVEQALRLMPGVVDAAVVPIERFGEQALAAFVVADAGAQLSESDVRAFLAARLAPFKLPRSVTFLAELPRIRSAKLDYQTLRALALGEDTTDQP